MDTQVYTDWIGREERARDTVTLAPLHGLSAALDRDDPPFQPGEVIPALWHWLYFLPIHRASELAEDGHAKLGGFLPPVPLPSRMWAGSRLIFHQPLRVGDAIERVSRIESIQPKQGRSGPLVFVTVQHSISGPSGLAITEQHDIVYREHVKGGGDPPEAPANFDWQRIVNPDLVLLFRYSALTFNAHRIHLDRDYCVQREHYPGLVVHGPLIATLLLDLLRRNTDAEVAEFSFRAVSPLFDTEPFALCGRLQDKVAHLWARGHRGGLAMEAKAVLR